MWRGKFPIAYFVIDGLNADVKSNLVIEAINRLQTVNVRVVSLICDDNSTNYAVGAKLGASLTGGLVYESQSVIKISIVTERCLRFVCGYVGDTLPQKRNLRLALQVAVLETYVEYISLFC